MATTSQVAEMIRKTVIECTSTDAPSYTTNRKLNKFADSSSTRGNVFECLIDQAHSMNERSQRGALKLIKMLLFKFTTMDAEILDKIETLCVVILLENADSKQNQSDADLRQTVQFLRALVSSKRSPTLAQVSIPVDGLTASTLSSDAGSVRSKLNGSMSGPNTLNLNSTDFASRLASISKLSAILSFPGGTPPAISSDLTPLFPGPQQKFQNLFERYGERWERLVLEPRFGVWNASFHSPTLSKIDLRIDPVEREAASVQLVQAAADKISDVGRNTAESGGTEGGGGGSVWVGPKDEKSQGNPAEKKLAKSFVPYAEQKDLNVPVGELANILNCVKGAETNGKVGELATKVLVKVLLDILHSDGPPGGNAVSAALLEVYHGSTFGRFHSLTILLNLSVHVNLYAPPPSAAGKDVFQSTRLAHASFAMQDALFATLCLLMKRAAQDCLKSAKFWGSAAALTLHFVTHGGRIHPAKVQQIDVRSLTSMAESVRRVEENVKESIVLMLSLSLYKPDGSLWRSKFECVGGAPYFLRLCRSSRSEFSRQLLVKILVDSVGITLVTQEKICSLQTFVAAAQFLRVANAYAVLPSLFIIGREDLFALLEEKLFFETFDPGLVDRGVVRRVLEELAKIVARVKAIPVEFESHVRACLAEDSDVDEMVAALAILRALIMKPDGDADLEIAESWLFKIHTECAAAESDVWDYVGEMEAEALNEGKPPSRGVYVRVTERLILHTLVKKSAESALAPLESIGERLSEIVEAGERNEQLLLKIFDLISSAVCTPTNLNPPLAATQNSNSNLNSISNFASLNSVSALQFGNEENIGCEIWRTCCTGYRCTTTLEGKFLRGNLTAHASLLRNIPPRVLGHLLTHISGDTHGACRETIVRFLIHVISETSPDPAIKNGRTKFLTQLGGVAFFKAVMADPDPIIAHLTSKYLLEHLMATQPAEYRTRLNRLVAKAQALNKEQLLTNSYLQLKEILL